MPTGGEPSVNSGWCVAGLCGFGAVPALGVRRVRSPAPAGTRPSSGARLPLPVPARLPVPACPALRRGPGVTGADSGAVTGRLPWCGA